ncbi:MAG: hypothetical protein ABIQ35_14970 [Verrucomicrobiota bacterium]
MNALLICPSERTEVSALAEMTPLVNFSVLGNPFIYYWLEHLAGCGVKSVRILADDRPDQVRTLVGNGAQWGLRIEVVPESDELSCDDARAKYSTTKPENRITESDHVVLLDHFPGCNDQNIFASYAEFFRGAQQWLTQKSGQTQIGVREVQPGVWVGLRSQIASDAKLIAPCWIGQNVLIKSGSEIGPMAFLENGVVVERRAAISESLVGGNTFVGELTHVTKSFALGNTLVKMESASIVRIPDNFLLCGLKDKSVSIECGNLVGRLAAWACLGLTSPFALVTVLKAKLSRHRALRPRRATVPSFVTQSSSIVYHEFAMANGWWKRWPQLLNVARGEFTWVGNRPLTHIEAGKLSNEFERLWLASPIGLISQGDSEGCTDVASDDARAHASFYAAQANWRLDFQILWRATKRLLTRKIENTVPVDSAAFKDRPVSLAAR